MEPSWVIAIVAVINLALSVSAIMFTWHSNRTRAQRVEIEALQARLAEESGRRRDVVGELRDRLTRMEAEMTHLPSAVQVAAMNGDLASLAGSVRSMDTRMERIEAYLMESRK